VIEVKNVSKRYENQWVLKNVSETLPSSGITSIIGPNGAGKSTLLSVMSRLLTPDQGLVMVDSLNVNDSNSEQLAKVMSVLRQENHFTSRLSVYDLVSFGRYPYSKGRLNKEDQHYINQALSFLDLLPLADQAGTAMMLMVNGGKINAYSPGSRFGFIFDVLGFKPSTTFAATGQHGNTVSPEFIMEANPDWLFVLDRDNAIGNKKEGASANQVLDNPLVRRTNAWKNQHVVYLDSGSLYIAGGIQSYGNLMNQIKQVLSNTKPQS